MKPYYEHDGITIYHGDCREVLPALGRFDALISDPPFGLGKALSGGTWGAKYSGGLSWDQEFPKFLPSIIERCAVAALWGGNYFGLPPSRCWLVWQKPDAVKTMSPVELAWTNLDSNSRFISHTIAATNAERVDHPTQKPLRVMRWTIDQVGDSAETILDPFMGSGTTLRAAKDLGRKAIGIEIEERYCEIAAKRLAQGILGLTEG